MRSVSVSRKEGKLDPSHHEVVEEDDDVVCDESSESTGVRSRVTARLVTLTPVAVPCGRATPAGGRGIPPRLLRGKVLIKEISGAPVHSSAGTPFFLLYLRPLRHRPGSMRLGALPARARWLNHRHLFLRRTVRMIVLRLSWEGGLPVS